MFQYNLLAEEADLLGINYKRDMELLRRNVEELYLADVIVAPSNYSRNSYTDPELIKKVKVNLLGANLPYRCRTPKKTSGFVILMVGNDFMRKGTHYLIEAFKLIDRSDAELWIRGNVPEFYRKLISDDRIRVIPAVTKNKLMELYLAADVFVQPSIDEGFGMTVLEALSFGLPLVVTENVGAKDLLNEKVSIQVPIRNPEALANAISQAAELPGMAFDEARKAILRNASWQNTSQRMIDEVYIR
jgi:glycosyltransferase involved in cell wall biosynthesis